MQYFTDRSRVSLPQVAVLQDFQMVPSNLNHSLILKPLQHQSVPQDPIFRSRLLQHGSSHGWQILQTSCSTMGSSTGCSWKSAPGGAHGLQGTSALPLETLLPSFCIDLSGCRAASLNIFADMGRLLGCVHRGYLCSTSATKPYHESPIMSYRTQCPRGGLN